jgi:chemotaxis protein histidine kinase CheA
MPDSSTHGLSARILIDGADIARKASHDRTIEVDEVLGFAEAIARAEAAVDSLSGEFADWMRQDVQRLDTCREAIHTVGIHAGLREELFRIAHDIKGTAATLGFPQAGLVAGSLCQLIDGVEEPGSIPLELVDRHIDATSAIIREAGKPDASAVAEELAASLRRVTIAFLARDAKADGAAIAAADAPPTAPR